MVKGLKCITVPRKIVVSVKVHAHSMHLEYCDFE